MDIPAGTTVRGIRAMKYIALATVLILPFSAGCNSQTGADAPVSVVSPVAVPPGNTGGDMSGYSAQMQKQGKERQAQDKAMLDAQQKTKSGN